MIALALSANAARVWGQNPEPTVQAEAEESPAALLRQGLELYRTKQYTEAATRFERYLKTHPDSLETRKLLAQCYLRLDQPELALPHLREVIARLPEDASVREALRQAEEMLRQKREEEAKKPKPEEIQGWFSEAEKRIKEKKFSQAEELLRQVLQERPEMEPALLRLAEICAATGRFGEAASLYRRLLGLGGPGQQEIELRLARVLAWAERYPEAIVHFEKYLKQQPENSSARLELAEVYRWSGSPAKAIPHYERVLEKQPEDRSARMGLGLAYQDLERHAEAVKEFDLVLESEPSNEQAHKARAVSFQQLQQEKKRLAYLAQEQRNYAEAIRLLREYLDANPEETDVLLRLGQLHSWSGELDRAREHYQRYLEKRPDDHAARLELAEVASWQADYVSARQEFLAVVRAQPENLRALVGLIRSYQWSGDLGGVEAYLDWLERLEPRHSLLAEVRGQLALARKRKMREQAEKLQETNDYAAAVAAYREYLTAYGPDKEIELRIPRLYAWSRQYEQAIEEYRSYLLRYPDEHMARLELAEVQRWNADYEPALQNYSTFLAQEPRNPRALFGRAEALYAMSDDPFRVRRAYQKVLEANPRDTLAATRYNEIRDRLRPQFQVQTFGLFDSDKLARGVSQVQVIFLLPEGYRLATRFQGSYTHQCLRRIDQFGRCRPVPLIPLRLEDDPRFFGRNVPVDEFLRLRAELNPRIDELNQHIEEFGGTLWGARAGLRVERQRSWGSWGGDAQVGGFTDERVSVAFGGDINLKTSERGQLWTRYEHEEAAFEMNTLASLAAGLVADSWRLRYRHLLPHDFDFSTGYGIAHISDSDRFGFPSNLRNSADARLAYRRSRYFQPGYSYSVSAYRSVSPLYFSPGLYQAHRFEYLVALGRPRPAQFVVNGSLGLGRIDGLNTFEVTAAPELRLRLRGGLELDLAYQFGQSRTSAFLDPTGMQLRPRPYRVHAFWITVRFPLPRSRR